MSRSRYVARGGRHGRLAILAPCAAALAALCGCASPQIHFDATAAETGLPQAAARDKDGTFVGLALSGGGSRAAVFAAAGMEALDEHGLLARVDDVSSVSGGSIAAAVLVSDAARGRGARDAAYFERLRAAAREDFQDAVGKRQFGRLRWFSPSRRATSFKEVLDERLLDGMTLGELRGVRPRLLVNATLYDNGRRFVITTLPQHEIAFDFNRLAGTGRTLSQRPAVRPMSFAHARVLGAVPDDLPLSLAVAASAGVPFLIGPVAIQVGERYWHLGDGGLYDNTGVETLEQLFAQRQLAGGEPLPALILALDAVSKADEDELTRDRRFGVSRHAEFVVDVPLGRAEAYHDATWQAIREERGGVTETIRLRYTQAPLDPLDVPASCRGVDTLCRPEDIRGGARSDADCRRALREHLAGMPTRLRITPCNAELLERAAHALVHDRLGERFPAERACRLERAGDEP